MKQSDWQRAFGQPDQAFHRAFTETLEQLEEMNMKRRYRISTLLAAAVLLTLAFAGAALYILPALLIYRYFQEDILLGVQLSELK